ncbi:Succinate--CoA ligase ADP-forming subunit beta, mitochondrial [Hondaea fermentalgiana]|uniref:Succinate--CoA ligase ADP-forming subunit beta, mitochondrial n=1 Tax=Hondaea fermentalgiana TaxID=2315210 RepID=A0A2R5GGP5_9STRA|nr:Succinate--CoA ligase ADP-forming subunit beta, mitochondrial [Hondaea fermentalgiana]|eukprot:GBG29509.1 Succinate--CoA ligase ADP-forming subunit beta, mitochondrial [Hondaea fermentalgiana]
MEKFSVNVPRVAELAEAQDVESFVGEVRAENSGAVFRVSAPGRDAVESTEPVEIGEAVRTWLQGSADESQAEAVTIEEVVAPSELFMLSIALEPGHNGPVIRGAKILPDEPEEATADDASDAEKTGKLVKDDTPRHSKEVTDTVDIMSGPSEAQTYHLAKGMGFKEKNIPLAQAQIEFLYYMFIGCDAVRLETQTLAEVQARSASDAARGEQEVACLDVTLELDEAAIFRQRDLSNRLHDTDAAMYPGAGDAREAGLGYIPGSGSVGMIVNGSGLAMATSDMLAAQEITTGPVLTVGRHGHAEDVSEAVAAAVRILRADPAVKVILVNIFGGATACDEVARGLIMADDEAYIDLPLVVRIDGCGAPEAESALEASPVPEIPADNLMDAILRVQEALTDGGSAP